MYEFEYQRPSTALQVQELLAADLDAKILAGGMSLLPAMKLRLARPSMLIDLAEVPSIRGISVAEDHLVIGAMTRHCEVASSPELCARLPGLAKLASGIGDRQVRNRGTIGGSVANSDPAACYPSALLGLGAIVSTNKRSIGADEFFLGMFETALANAEFITSIRFPTDRDCAYIKFRQPASHFSLVGVFVSRGRDRSVRVAVTGASSHVFRCIELEDALETSFRPEVAQATKVSSANLSSDMHADATYRSALIPILAGRAVSEILRSRNEGDWQQ
jgi:aerobic carbon-monoxide dehydrogenase medium subunit